MGAIWIRAAPQVEVPLEERISRVAVVPHISVQLREFFLAAGLLRQALDR
jgi:hypothetical protein